MCLKVDELEREIVKTDATLPSPRAGALRRFRPFVMPAGVVIGVFALVTWAASHPGIDAPGEVPSDVSDVVARADAHLQDRWQKQTWNGQPLQPAKPAGDLVVLRRLSLALHGTVPSLEEIRQFEADEKPDRLQRWTVRLLEDDRFATYFAERLARGYVSTEGGTFVLYRRDRFTSWLRSQLKNNTPYDAVVRKIISSTGLWTGTPSTNFMTYAYNEGKFDVNKLTGRTVRAFLGQRFDCAQCHDHPFDDRWKQHHFEGLAAYYGQARLSAFGVEDREYEKKEPIEYVIKDRETLEERVAKPGVPFHPEWLPEEGTRREKLAAWITHPKNRRFERATVNRVWALLFGRPYTYPHYPVDDIPDPDQRDEKCDTKLLDILGSDFREHDYDLRRLILAITSTRAFRLSFAHPADRPADSADQVAAIKKHVTKLEHNWAVFPLTRLRPEQIIGSMIQTNSVRTIDLDSNLFVRFVRAIREQGFIEEYGDPGGEELVETAGTIPQSLLRMNGKLSNEVLQATPFSAAGRIASLSGSDENCLESCFLVVFGRRPNNEERQNWLPRLSEAKNDDQRKRIVEDLYWAMFNSPEFSWNH
ncbi:MAG: DUF1549 domain-containing protein [Planctomycetaceae bacterium]